MRNVLKFKAFDLSFDTATGETKTLYHDGAWTGGLPVADDLFHAEKLSITDKEHRLEHELFHHLVAMFAFNERDGSQVLRHAATDGVHIEPTTAYEEWLVTGFTYYFHDVEYQEQKPIGRLSDYTHLLAMKITATILLDTLKAEL